MLRPDSTIRDLQNELAGDEVLAGHFGRFMGEKLNIPVKDNGRFDVYGGDKTTVGLARTLVRWINDYLTTDIATEKRQEVADEMDQIMADEKEQLLKDLLCTALEGGSNDWYVILNDNQEEEGANSIHETPFTPCGFLLVADKEANDDQVRVDREQINKGWAIMERDYPKHYNRAMDESWDAETADVFFQCVCWGEVVFG